MRTLDTEFIIATVAPYKDTLKGLDIESWVANPANIALRNENGDVALFERQWRLPSVVCGHYFFTSRGRQAINASLYFLEEIFTGPYGIGAIVGLTPIDNRAALWMNRQIGFKSCGKITTDIGSCELVFLTKYEWLRSEGNKE